MNGRPRSFVLLNPRAGGGRAGQRWPRVLERVTRHSRPRVQCSDGAGHWVEAVRAAAADGVGLFLAAGGDGTVHALANALLALPSSAGPVTLGAIGLGSSNDFHKPILSPATAVPLRVDPNRTGARDVGVATYRDEHGQLQRRHFLVSASLGMTAEANGLFNDSARMPRGLKRCSTAAAIAYAALHTLARYQPYEATLRTEPDPSGGRMVALNNLSVMKTAFLSGWLRFDTPVAPDDGRFAVNLCHGMTRLDALGMLWALSRGRFLRSRRPGTRHWSVPRVSLEVSRPVALELDGEVVRTTAVQFDVLSRRLRCCA